MGSQVATTEAAEHMVLAEWLTLKHGLVWCHVPNGGARHIATAVAMSKLGTKRGVPDILVFTPPPAGGVGAAIEMKRVGGGRATAEQKVWLESLAAYGWRTKVCHGATDAIEWLVGLGY